MKIKNKAAQALGRLSVARRHEGKSDKWISEYYKKLRATKKNEQRSNKKPSTEV